MREGWEVKKLGEICEFENGDRGVNYPSKAHRTESGVPFINAGHLTSNGLDISKMDYISRERYNLLGSGKVQKGNILFCLRGSLGKFAKVKEFTEGAIASSLVIVRPKLKITSEFLMAYFESKICADMIFDFGNGAAQPNLSAGSLKKFEIPLPPLPEQKRIVAILDKAFGAIAKAKANAEQNLKNAKELFESYLQGVFENKGEGWEEKTLGEVCHFVRGPFGGSLKKNCFKKDGIAVYEQQHAIYNQFNGIRYFVDDIKFEEMKRFELLAGDLIMSCSGTMGKVAVVPKNIKKGIINQALLKLTPSNHLNVEYLKCWMTSNVFQKSLAKYTVGAAIKNVASVKILKQIDTPLPSLPEQKRIVQELDALSTETKKLEAIYQQKTDDLEELKKSVLQKAFTGKL